MMRGQFTVPRGALELNDALNTVRSAGGTRKN